MHKIIIVLKNPLRKNKYRLRIKEINILTFLEMTYKRKKDLILHNIQIIKYLKHSSRIAKVMILITIIKCSRLNINNLLRENKYKKIIILMICYFMVIIYKAKNNY